MAEHAGNTQDTQRRRAQDKIDFEREFDEVWNPDAEINSHKMLYAIYREVRELKAKVGSMEEMLAVWASTKGFLTTLKWISRVLIGISIVCGVIAGMWYAFKKAVVGL